MTVPFQEGRPHPSSAGSEGPYAVMITLMHPTMSIFGTALMHHPGGIMGDSLLVLDQAFEVTGVTPRGAHQFQLLPNGQGRLGMVKLIVRASDLHTAERQAMEVAQPFLSLLAATQNVPLSVHAVTTVEQDTGVIALSAGLAGKEKRLSLEGFSPLPVVTDEQIANVFSAYREALGAQDPFQKIISLWRVFEGLKSVRQTMLQAVPAQERETVLRRGKLPTSIETVPERYRDGVDDATLTRVLGKSHQAAVEQFTSEYRDAVAHLTLKPDRDGTPRPVRTADTWSDVMACWNVAQLLEYVLREFLKETIGMHPQYRSLTFD
ncbi:methylamine utilization protein MauJ [Deinococcus humi]|uniref:Uncharacterized protein n=1 Tax=Deinococcus humi TaxID=662880 RepID=A0A7W8JZW0_9DEIO|nr:methylamine utilization protein MauJ [Deinococcus humi]MBB5366291.1 hypothetical protein [Deinococcus humi]